MNERNAEQSQQRRFVYFYLMNDEPERVRVVARQHAAHWKGLRLPDYVGGPFQDRTGGLITFSAPNLAAAQRFVAEDPFMREGLVEGHWLKEWTPD